MSDFMSHLDSLSFKLVSDAQKKKVESLLSYNAFREILTGLGTTLEQDHVPFSWRPSRLSEAMKYTVLLQYIFLIMNKISSN